MKNYNIDRADKYNLDEIDSRNALINIIWGGRSDGKSFQVKHKKGIIPYLESMVKTAYEDRDRFILVRRLREELTSEKIEGYFKDVDVKKLTNGEYDTISYFRREIYLANYVDFKKVNGEKIGYVVPLSGEQNYAGVSFLDVKNIIMEEFMTRTVYLANEPDKLINLWNTVDRKRGIVRMWLVGNSISKICPYLTELENKNKVIYLKYYFQQEHLMKKEMKFISNVQLNILNIMVVLVYQLVNIKICLIKEHGNQIHNHIFQKVLMNINMFLK